jgi:hypothetical protein
VKRGVATLAALATAAVPAVAHSGLAPTATPTYRILSNPHGGDDFLFRNAIQDDAQSMSNRLFAALQTVLGGTAPTLNFVQTDSPLTPAHFSAQGTDQINIDPLGVETFTNANNSAHSPAVLDMPHEMAHLRQTQQVLADLVQREGGAQAFADLVTPTAAKRSGIAYTPGNYDANYADYVRQVHPLGPGWLLGGQFGHAPVQFP